MNDVDRWVQGDGPEPQAIRALLDPARAVPEMPPGLQAELDRSLRKEHAEKQRRQTRARQRNVAISVGVMAAAAAAALLMLGLRSPSSPPTAIARDAGTTAQDDPFADFPMLPETPTSNPSGTARSPRAPGTGSASGPAVPRAPRGPGGQIRR